MVSPALCTIGTLQLLRYSVIDPSTMVMLAGRDSWPCQGTTPPGWTTSLRSLSIWPLKASPLELRSIADSTSSVTPTGLVSPDVSAPSMTWSAGHSPAYAEPEKAAAEASSPSASTALSGLRYVTFESILRFSFDPARQAVSVRA